jgi:hypothetical protein
MPDRLAFFGNLVDGTDYQPRALEGQTPLDVMHLMRQRNGVLSAFSNPRLQRPVRTSTALHPLARTQACCFR